MAKSLLNNLLGRFGISLDKAVTSIVDTKTYEEIAHMSKINSYIPISSNNYLVSYDPILDPKIIKENGLDIIEILGNKEIKEKGKEIRSLKASSVVISAAVNSYARVHMQRLKLDILDKKGKLYYSDTDSLVTNRKLDKNLVDKNVLGKLKLEHEVTKFIAIAPKWYYLLNSEGKEVIRAKGVFKESINLSFFLTLLIRDWVNKEKFH